MQLAHYTRDVKTLTPGQPVRVGIWLCDLAESDIEGPGEVTHQHHGAVRPRQPLHLLDDEIRLEQADVRGLWVAVEVAAPTLVVPLRRQKGLRYEGMRDATTSPISMVPGQGHQFRSRIWGWGLTFGGPRLQRWV